MKLPELFSELFKYPTPVDKLIKKKHTRLD